MSSDYIALVTIPSMFSWIAWVIFSTIRRYKIAKLQAEVQARLLEKVGSSQDLLAYAQTEPGKQLLSSLKVERVSPYGKILGALQAGIVLMSFGVALLLLRSHISGAEEGFLLFGTLAVALGTGFGISAATSYYLSKSFGLLNSSPS